MLSNGRHSMLNVSQPCPLRFRVQSKFATSPPSLPRSGLLAGLVYVTVKSAAVDSRLLLSRVTVTLLREMATVPVPTWVCSRWLKILETTRNALPSGLEARSRSLSKVTLTLLSLSSVAEVTAGGGCAGARVSTANVALAAALPTPSTVAAPAGTVTVTFPSTPASGVTVAV